MPAVLRFGIDSLDELLGVPGEKFTRNKMRIPHGIYLPEKEEITCFSEENGTAVANIENEVFTTSVCLIGPTGTGKSIFGLHMASKYVADCLEEQSQLAENKEQIDLPTILYVSTDLTYNMAHRTWVNFALNYPFHRKDPFTAQNSLPGARILENGDPVEIKLLPCNPIVLAKDFGIIETSRSNVIFMDMASYTAGDDWGFLHKLLSLLPSPKGDHQPRHLVVIDAIEGFEALAGEVNAFGEKSSRRSRIAQVMRLIAAKCHVLLVVEQGAFDAKNERLAEEFVADTVIRLESVTTRNYERRVLKVEKVRGQSHIRGQHHYSIRSGNGSTTGNQINPDDPEVILAFPKAKSSEEQLKQSYVQVFHSVHRLSRKIMEVKGSKVREKLKPNTYYAAFGIKYLDNMLGGTEENTRSENLVGEATYCHHDTRGLPCRSTTALIGDSLTQKSTLGKAFLSRCFHSFDERILSVHSELKKNSARRPDSILLHLIERKMQLQVAGFGLKDADKEKLRTATWQDCYALVKQWAPDELPFPYDPNTDQVMSDEEITKELAALLSTEELEALEELDEAVKKRKSRVLLEEARLTHFAAWLLDYQYGVAVMLATHNTHAEQLANEFISWFHSKSELRRLKEKMIGYKSAFKEHIKNGTICRRLEIHSLSSEVLVHMVQQLIRAAQRKILRPEVMTTHRDTLKTEVTSTLEDRRYEMSWPIRVVVDDFSTVRDIFPELREDPLLLPSVLFNFEREGVTTLIVDTQSGKPDTPIAERFESELRKMVHHNLYTWRVPFYGESRVAITAIPPLSSDYAGIVRELRWESESHNKEIPAYGEPATVDPHFELYTGLEEGKPQSVPLHARFYGESAAMEEYIAAENRFLSERFAVFEHPAQTTVPCVILGMPPGTYDDMRDLAYLQRDTRADHTFLFQVDEFWAMRRPSRHKRAGAFHPQWSYLNTATAEAVKPHPVSAVDYEMDLNADPYELFQLRRGDPLPKKLDSEETLPVLRRRHFYEMYYRDFADYDKFVTGTREDLLVDRVPFSWDFGFLLCRENAWKTDRTFVVYDREGGVTPYDVQGIWKSLTKAGADKGTEKIAKAEVADTPTPAENTPAEENALPDEGAPSSENAATQKDEAPLDYVSWRLFIEASKKAAEELSDKSALAVTAFDFAQISPESFSCLILEIWLSEIYDSLVRKINQAESEEIRAKVRQDLEDLLTTVTKRRLFIPLSDEENETAPGLRKRKPLTLFDLVDRYWLDLYKSWLLLIEVINFDDIIGESAPFDFDFRSKNTDFSAVASRHWYKTASQCPADVAAKEPLVPVRLPGHFSVRGDWFLAVSGGSRSIRQAERALDLLNSRRSNVSRLQLGIGLPTREPLHAVTPRPNANKSTLGILRTKLMSHERGLDRLEYEYFLKIAARDPVEKRSFCWLWRSGLADYANSNRIWHEWLSRTLVWWHRKLLRYKSVWLNSFKVYDKLTNHPPSLPEEFGPYLSDLVRIRAEMNKETRLSERKKVVQTCLDQYRVTSLAQLKVRSDFLESWKVLKEELKQACEEGNDSPTAQPNG